MVIRPLLECRRSNSPCMNIIRKAVRKHRLFSFSRESIRSHTFRAMKKKVVAPFLVSLITALSAIGQINCPQNLPLTLLGNTSYCIGTPGSELSVQQNYDGYEWIPTSETGQSVLLTAGNYWLVVTHYTGCTDTLQFEVQQVSNPPQPTIVANGPTQFCEGGSVTLSVPTWYPYYEWSTGSVSDEITVYESGTYNVSIEDWIGCESSSNSIQIIVEPLPTAAFSPNLNGYGIEFNNLSLNATDYEWNFGDGIVSNDFEPTHTYTIGGEVSMYLVASNGCGSDTAYLDLASVSVSDLDANDNVLLFPNPATDLLHVRSSDGFPDDVLITVYHADGRMRDQFRITEPTTDQWTIDVSNYESGYYFLVLESAQRTLNVPFGVVR